MSAAALLQTPQKNHCHFVAGGDSRVHAEHQQQIPFKLPAKFVETSRSRSSFHHALLLCPPFHREDVADAEPRAPPHAGTATCTHVKIADTNTAASTSGSIPMAASNPKREIAKLMLKP